MRLLALGAGCVVLLGGCGLTLDYSPPEDASIGFDATQRLDGGRVEDCDEDSDCDDDDVCDGLEVCIEGRCLHGTPLDCDDAFDCTIDSCDPQTGCERQPDDSRCADDGVDCTIERCDETTGCLRELSHDACDDEVFCTLDACDPSAGCLNEPMDGRCGSGACDPGEGCIGTECGEDSDCFRGPCDAEVHCDSGRCVRAPMIDGTPCDDGNPCTRSSACTAGECRGAEIPTCPGAPCVRCNPAGGGCDGSIVAPSGASCDDGNMCTLGDACDGAGSCVASAVRGCVSIGACRTSICNPSTGACEPGTATGGCDDGDACTVGDSCVDGACVPGARMTCPPDGDPCTSDRCVGTTPGGGTVGCTYPLLAPGTACDDRDLCTATSACGTDGVCRGTSPTCVDADPCTTSTCDATSGACSAVFHTDGRTCDLNAACTAGGCTCRPGFADCRGDGSCECDSRFGFCGTGSDGLPTCVPYRACPTCATGTVCCPCTGVCHAAGCDGCCMGCPSAT